MISALDHLPDRKRRDLERAVQILFAEFEEATALSTQKWKKQGRILKIILYGSYARGDWVEDPVGGYFSDYDLLVVVSDERLTDTIDYWAKADDHLTRELTIARTISAPVNFIVHGFDDVNDQLQRGRSFFIDVVEQGIALYEAEGHPFARPKPLTPEAALAEARNNFDRWFDSASDFLRLSHLAQSESMENKAAFLQHQAAEQFYHCVLLALTLYSPKSHKLNFLRGQAEDLVPALIEAWPRATKAEQRCFELLRQAYVNARYSPQYTITGEQLEWIAARLERLQCLVRDACEHRLAALAEAV